MQRLRGDAFTLAQVSHERGQVAVGQRRVMLLRNLSVFRQRMLDEALPPCRVVARAIAAHRRPVQH